MAGVAPISVSTGRMGRGGKGYVLEKKKRCAGRSDVSNDRGKERTTSDAQPEQLEGWSSQSLAMGTMSRGPSVGKELEAGLRVKPVAGME